MGIANEAPQEPERSECAGERKDESNNSPYDVTNRISSKTSMTWLPPQHRLATAL